MLRAWTWAAGIGGVLGGFYGFQGSLREAVLIGAALAGVAFLALSSRWVRSLVALPHLRAAGFVAFWMATLVGGWMITGLVWVRLPMSLVASPYFLFQFAVLILSLGAWLRVRRRLRLSIDGDSRSARWIWLVVLGHGIGWFGMVELGPWAQPPSRGTGAYAVGCVTSVILPWTVAPLLPLAAWSLRGALGSRAARRWALGCTLAIALAFGRQVASLAFPAAFGPAMTPKWQGLGLHCGVVAGLAIALVVMVRGWHESLDDEFDGEAFSAEPSEKAGPHCANPFDAERR